MYNFFDFLTLRTVYHVTIDNASKVILLQLWLFTWLFIPKRPGIPAAD